ncbi:MAG: hypothetical protein KDI88_15835 [Gammaproteobacteria bacterium]|nr:hypothetical protein [Gammaproteobacteria bacterium]
MPDHREIKRFVQQGLGCNCPESVFDNIRCDRAGTDGRQFGRIVIGDRLLVLMLDVDGQGDLPAAVREVIRAGVAERDRNGWNRVRLVLRGESPTDWRGRAEAAFAATLPDDRTHMHVVDVAATASLGI